MAALDSRPRTLAPVAVVALLCAGMAALVLAASPARAAEPADATPDGPEPLQPEAKAAAETGTVGEDRPNGFALTNLRVPRNEIRGGGPPRDGIPRVDAPKFVSPDDVDWVVPESQVLGLIVGGEARAYPIHVLERHQVVNDVIAGEPTVVTFDPLSGTPIAYVAKVNGKPTRFGVSGLIYNSNFLLYDEATESLWSQFSGEAIAGPSAGKRLERVPVVQVAWLSWLQSSPESVILVPPLRGKLNYRVSPYQQYWVSEAVPFPVRAKDDRFHPKEVVLGVRVDGTSRAYLGSVLTEAGGRIADEIQGRRIRIHYSGETGTFEWEAPPEVEVTDAYWFSWKAFHPDTEVWNVSKPAAP